MQLRLERFDCNDICTFGRLSIVAGFFQCFTLENAVRPDGVTIPNETAIPSGDYTVDITFSPRFGQRMPLLVNVQGFVGIRIHSGNTVSYTSGCILVGEEMALDDHAILHSRAAYAALFERIDAVVSQRQPVILTITNPPTVNALAVDPSS